MKKNSWQFVYLLIIPIVIIVVMIIQSTKGVGMKPTPLALNENISEVVKCNTDCILANNQDISSVRGKYFTLFSLKPRDSYLDFIFFFEESFIVKDFRISFSFLDVNGNSIENRELCVDGVYSDYFNSVTCEVPAAAVKVYVSHVVFDSYKVDEVLHADLGDLNSFDHPYKYDVCSMKIVRENNVFIKLNYKKKAKYSKAILSIHDENGRILNSFILDEKRYNCRLNTDFGPASYSVCFLN